MQIQGSRDHRRTSDERSCTHVSDDTTKDQCFILYGIFKGKSALMMFDRHANLKYKYGNRHFWSEGYYVSTVGLNSETIAKYIREQEAHDIMMDKLSVKEYKDPFEEKGIKEENKRRAKDK